MRARLKRIITFIRNLSDVFDNLYICGGKEEYKFSFMIERIIVCRKDIK